MSDFDVTAQLTVEGRKDDRRPYRKPRLEQLGDLRTLTLGGSPGLNDSGSQFTRRPPGTMPGKFPPLPEGVPPPDWPPT